MTRRDLLISAVSLTVGAVYLCPAPGAAQGIPSHAQVEKRLGYLVDMPAYSKAKPPSQASLMQLALDLRLWGAYPEAYRGKGNVPTADAFITRASVRRFIRDLTGHELRIWKVPEGNIGGWSTGKGLTWIYNTGNTMYERPQVRIVGRESRGNRLTVRYDITHRKANLSTNPPAERIGSGSATLEQVGANWIVTTWQPRRAQP